MTKVHIATEWVHTVGASIIIVFAVNNRRPKHVHEAPQNIVPVKLNLQDGAVRVTVL